MDYLKHEERLIKAQLYLTRSLRTTELLSKMDSVALKIGERLPEKIFFSVKTDESLSKNYKLKLPLKVRGRMLGPGRHKVRYYSEEELRKSVDSHGQKIIPIKLDHRKNEVSATVGTVSIIYWDDEQKAIMYEGHINDETQARNILDGVVKEVSATIESSLSLDATYGVVGKDLEYSELSLVEDGAYKNNSLEVVV